MCGQMWKSKVNFTKSTQSLLVKSKGDFFPGVTASPDSPAVTQFYVTVSQPHRLQSTREPLHPLSRSHIYIYI